MKPVSAPAPLEELEARIGHHFGQRELLERALTHRSHPVESLPAAGARGHNEPLEFLGDAILGYLTCEFLFRTYPGSPEGRLSRLKNYLVSAVHLHEVALSLDLGKYLRIGRGEELGGCRTKPRLLANALEALIAALHLDGGLGAARLFVEGHILNVSLQAIEAAATPLNAKGALIELAHSCGLPLPRYTVVGQSGPEHERLFTVEVRLGSDVSACAEGSTRKQASKAAAQKVLDRLISELKQNAAPGADSGSVDA